MLAELLELLHTSEDRWTSLTAEVRERKDHDGLQAAVDREAAAFFDSPAAGPPGTPHDQDCTGVEESGLSLSATSRGACRVLRTTDDGPDLLVVDARGGMLHVDPHGVADVEPNPHRAGARLRLELLALTTAPALLAGACRLHVTGTATVAGRECVTADAVLRAEGADLVQNLLGFGVRTARIAVDRTTGVLLLLQTTDDDGRPLHRLETTAVRFDVPVDDRLFALDPPPGSTLPDPEQHHAMTLLEAACRVPFTLFAPPSGPDSYPWGIYVTPDHPRRPTRVYLHRLGSSLRFRNHITSIVQAADTASMPDVTEWRPVRVGGLDANAWTGPDTAHVTAWRDGTGIWIRDADSLERAAELLDSLRPVDAGTDRHLTGT